MQKISNLNVPLDRDILLRNLNWDLAGTLKEVVGINIALWSGAFASLQGMFRAGLSRI